MDAPAAGPFLLTSSPELVEPVTVDSRESGGPSVTSEVFDVGGSAGATPFTSTGVEAS